MTFEQGDVVLLPFPFTDLSGQKRRPVLVLSSGRYNRKSADFVVCGITSVLRSRPHAVPLRPLDMAVGRLPLESRIRPDKLFTLKQTLGVKTLGRVKAGLVDQVHRELLSVMGWSA